MAASQPKPAAVRSPGCRSPPTAVAIVSVVAAPVQTSALSSERADALGDARPR